MGDEGSAEEIRVEAMEPGDWPAVRRIFEEGIATRLATFETKAPDWEAWDAAHLSVARLVARSGEAVVAWVALIPYSPRAVYAGVAEESVYVAEGARGLGIGRRLLEAAVAASEQAGIWTLQAGIFPENAPSLALHRRLGFREIGVHRRLGRLDGEWRDVVLLERRSDVVGT
jgi:L-amino acid N-acyltransferase YncA